MQNSVLKFLTILFVFLNLCSSASWAQTSSSELERADSLFRLKRYTQSFDLYQSIFEKHQYTPAMLLKMAFIEEGLNQNAQAAYYLNLYYLATLDKEVLTKLEELATKYRLEGYQTSETDPIYSIYLKNRSNITTGLSTLLVFLITIMVASKLKFHKQPYASFTFFVVFAIALLCHLQLGEGKPLAIISKNNTYLMDGPSAGSSVVSIVRDGHRVKITGKKDVWVQAKWGDKDVYIKETSLQLVDL